MACLGTKIKFPFLQRYTVVKTQTSIEFQNSILHLFSYYTLMVFLTMLSVILLSMLMILLWQQLELASEDTGLGKEVAC